VRSTPNRKVRGASSFALGLVALILALPSEALATDIEVAKDAPIAAPQESSTTPVPEAPVPEAPVPGAPPLAFQPLKNWTAPTDNVEDEVTIRRRKLRRAWPKVVLGLGVGALLAGGGMGIASRASESRARAAQYQSDEVLAIDAGRQQAYAANVLFIVGAVVTAVGASMTVYQVLRGDAG
jgi:hypothetical protein